MRAPEPNPTSSTEPLPELGLRRLFVQMGVGIVLLVAAFAAIGATFRQPIIDMGGEFVAFAGGPGVLLAFLVLDAIFLPIPHDVFSGLALIGGMPAWEITIWGTIGSYIGGSLGFAFARRLGKSPRFLAFLAKRGAKAHAIVERYGALGVFIGAVTPLPYVFTTWAAGALGMRWTPFLLVSLGRIPRIWGYLWLMELGFIRLQ